MTMELNFNPSANQSVTKNKVNKQQSQFQSNQIKKMDKTSFGDGYYGFDVYTNPTDNSSGDGSITKLLIRGIKKRFRPKTALEKEAKIDKDFEKEVNKAVDLKSSFHGYNCSNFYEDQYTYKRYEILAKGIQKGESEENDYLPGELYLLKRRWEVRNEIPEDKIIKTKNYEDLKSTQDLTKDEMKYMLTADK